MNTSENNKNTSQHRSVRHLTRLAMYTTLALALYGLESLLPPPIPVPGVKLGLANIVTLLLLRNYSAQDAATVLALRILLSAFAFGQAVSFAYSLAGGVCCFLIMYVINRLLQNHFLYLTSIFGALSHNLGQLLAAYVLTSVSGIMVYLPVLAVSGIMTGLFIGLCAHFSQKYLETHLKKLS